MKDNVKGQHLSRQIAVFDIQHQDAVITNTEGTIRESFYSWRTTIDTCCLEVRKSEKNDPSEAL
jgi:hypothetical protein